MLTLQLKTKVVPFFCPYVCLIGTIYFLFQLTLLLFSLKRLLLLMLLRHTVGIPGELYNRLFLVSPLIFMNKSIIFTLTPPPFFFFNVNFYAI